MASLDIYGTVLILWSTTSSILVPVKFYLVKFLVPAMACGAGVRLSEAPRPAEKNKIRSPALPLAPPPAVARGGVDGPRP